MASTTPNIGLTLPTGAEKVSRQIINDNNTKIDTAIGTLNSKITWTRKANLVTSGAYTIPASASLVLVEIRNTSGGTVFASEILCANYLPQAFVVYGGSGNQATFSVSGRDISISTIDTGRAVCIYYMG